MAKKEQLLTPVGVFKYCHLNKPDTRYKDDGEYSVTLVLDKTTAATRVLTDTLDGKMRELKSVATEGYNSAAPKTKAQWNKKHITEPVLTAGYSDEYDEEGLPTGNIILRFKTKASFIGRDGETIAKVVPLIDGRGQVIPASKRPIVYAGTEGRVAFSLGYAFIAKDAEAFMSLYLNQVQITTLVAAGGGSSFGAVDGSDFSAEELDEYEGHTKGSAGDNNTQAAGFANAGIDDEVPF